MIEITPNEQQEMAIEKAELWYKNFINDSEHKKQVFEIAGFAGTGKSTLVNFILKAIGLTIDDCLFLTYVGKAAMVLAMKGIPATTIHSAIYQYMEVPRTDSNGNIIMEDGFFVIDKKFVLKKHLPEHVKLLVIDEGFMVEDKLANDLLSFNLPVIVLGDPYQNSPIFGKPRFLINPDVVLTDIMRQNMDNPIIFLATKARNCDWSLFNYADYDNKVWVLSKDIMFDSFHKPVLDTIFSQSDAVICGRNSTREKLNNYIRSEVYEKKGELNIGDKLINRRNDWSRCLENTIYLTNGLIGFVEDINYSSLTAKKVKIDFAPDFLHGHAFEGVILDRKYLNMNYEEKKNYFNMYTNQLEYGYAITCHLAQGSEYQQVAVYNERFFRSDIEYSRWIYTAITRAIDRLYIFV